jgi:hypothetical protein
MARSRIVYGWSVVRDEAARGASRLAPVASGR